MATRLGHLTVETDRPRTLGAWWATVLDWAVVADDDTQVGIAPADLSARGILFVATATPSPHGSRLHLDVRPSSGSNQAAELARLLDLGATLIAPARDEHASWHVLADPDGNPFCLLREPISPDDEQG